LLAFTCDRCHHYYASLLAEYQDKLDVLREPIPERALYVPGDEGADKAHCFTNYEPHFNTAMRLDSVIMGFPPEGWTYVKSQTWPEAEKVYGYMDTKPYFEVGCAAEVFCGFLEDDSGQSRS
jgi:hypothetical protein